MGVASILNHVIGPVMRGPSSSHTAGAFHIAAMARSLLGGEPVAASFAFDPDGSYAKCFHAQGADLAFATGLLGWPITDDRFPHALEAAAKAGMQIGFATRSLDGADHPNAVEIELSAADGRRLAARANSVGGGAVEFVRLGSWPVSFTGDAWEVAVEAEPEAVEQALGLLCADGAMMGEGRSAAGDGVALLCVRRRAPLTPDTRARLAALRGVRAVWACEPMFLVAPGEPSFASAAEAVALSLQRGISLGQTALDYEARLLALPERDTLAEMGRRLDIMVRAVERGLDSPPPMRLLGPSAGSVLQAERAGRLAAGGLHARAAARALAAMHVSSGGGVVCAAPTGGSAGVLPGVLATLIEELGVSRERAVLALLAAGAIGVVVANRATFAAEVAGCQVEIGAAGAMAAAAVADAAGASAVQAADAAAIAFQNSMGSACDLVQGVVEIPCHTRNAAAAANAFLCADLILGGYANPIPLDETIDAVYATGRMLPAELRCTALGGLAAAPSARALRPIQSREGMDG
ncbi:MAG: hypothetical protein FJ291_26705 [Planctomycetes bacterium]|nr:hypothetical protein [Planctomycetota bacterium]